MRRYTWNHASVLEPYEEMRRYLGPYVGTRDRVRECRLTLARYQTVSLTTLILVVYSSSLAVETLFIPEFLTDHTTRFKQIEQSENNQCKSV
jgi:hypothetical protein